MPTDQEIVICGLDGVLALIEHRLHHLYNEEGVRHWEQFHAACDDDMPNLPLIERLNRARAEGVAVLLLSGRSQAVAGQTRQWLARWQIGYDALFLRPPGNFTPSAEFKAGVIAQHYPGATIRRLYESDSHLDVATWATAQTIPCTLIGHNQGNGESREQFELKVVRHACEHTVLYPFYGDDDFAWGERAQQLGLGICRLCGAAEQREEQHKRSLQARHYARERGLPPLEGSERQVAWAETVRLGAFGAIDKVLQWVARVNEEAQREDPDYWQSVQQGITRSIGYLEEQTDAKWWIDHRHGMFNNLDSGRALLSAIAQERGYL
ncbi:MAG: hypothetical protein OQL08_00615 [Gammaproteobacteria bacterium]|nr:hypothetical protein [Gammaproteobacteria bacterium]